LGQQAHIWVPLGGSLCASPTAACCGHRLCAVAAKSTNTVEAASQQCLQVFVGECEGFGFCHESSRKSCECQLLFTTCVVQRLCQKCTCRTRLINLNRRDRMIHVVGSLYEISHEGTVTFSAQKDFRSTIILYS